MERTTFVNLVISRVVFVNKFTLDLKFCDADGCVVFLFCFLFFEKVLGLYVRDPQFSLAILLIILEAGREDFCFSETDDISFYKVLYLRFLIIPQNK